MSNKSPYQNISDTVKNTIGEYYDMYSNAFEVISPNSNELNKFFNNISNNLKKNDLSYISISALCMLFKNLDTTKYSNNKQIIQQNFPFLIESQKSWNDLYQDYFQKAVNYRKKETSKMFQSLASDLRDKLGI